MVKAGAFVIRKTDLGGEKKRITELAKKFFLIPDFLKVHSERNKRFNLRYSVIDNSIDIFLYV